MYVLYKSINILILVTIGYIVGFIVGMYIEDEDEDEDVEDVHEALVRHHQCLISRLLLRL